MHILFSILKNIFKIINVYEICNLITCNCTKFIYTLLTYYLHIQHFKLLMEEYVLLKPYKCLLFFLF